MINHADIRSLTAFEQSLGVMSAPYKFEIIDKIGHGQFSTVYRAKWIDPPPLDEMFCPDDGTSTNLISPDGSQQSIGDISDNIPMMTNSNDSLVIDRQSPSRNQQHHDNQHQPPRRNERFVALKRIKFFDIQNAKARMDYLKEVSLLQQVKHPNIINFNISFIERNELFIVLELADGGDLSKLIRYFQKKKRLMPEQVILKYFTQVCSAVEYIHSKRILHRDIKPANIFMTSDGCVKLGDFGLGRFFSQNTRDAHSIVGTFYYMSPERIQESGYSFSSDVWSLGCVLYELITLNSPFSIMNQGQNLAAQEQNTNPYNLEWIIDRIIRAEYPSLDGYRNISPRLRYLTTECLNPSQEARPNMPYICEVVNGIQTSGN